MPTDTKTDERITKLEERYSFQERTIEQLNGEVLRQQNQIDDLIKRVKSLAEQVGMAGVEAEFEPPPHY